MKLESLKKSMQDPQFQRDAFAYGKFAGMPWGVGQEKAYHRSLCERALQKGETLSFDALKDHEDILLQALQRGQVFTPPDQVQATTAELADALRAAWSQFQAKGRTSAQEVAELIAALIAGSRQPAA